MTTPFPRCAVATMLLPGGGDIAASEADAIPQAVTEFANALASCEAAIATQPLSSTEMRRRLRGLAGAASKAAAATSSALGTIDASQSEPAVRAAFDRDLGRDDADALPNALIFDRYFRVERASSMARAQFVAYAAAAWAALFDDLPEAMLGRDEILALLAGLRASCTWLGLVGATGLDAAACAANDEGADASDATRTTSDIDVAARWIVGHHTFALFAIVGRDAALHAASAAASADEAATAAALLATATLTRALAAAQWYASDFPFATYRDVIRPTMEATGARGGFSGTQNADYARFKDARERATEALFERWGTDAASWPREVYDALGALHEMEVEAAEHHVLVAASKVERDGSLAQKASGDRQSAVAALREIVDATIADIADRFATKPQRRVFACKRDDVSDERPHGVTIEEKQLIVCRAYGAYWACSGLCTHAQADLSHGHMAGDCIVCPLHGSKFDPRTGAAQRPPATQPLTTYPVVEEGDSLYIVMQ